MMTLVGGRGAYLGHAFCGLCRLSLVGVYLTGMVGAERPQYAHCGGSGRRVVEGARQSKDTHCSLVDALHISCPHHTLWHWWLTSYLWGVALQLGASIYGKGPCLPRLQQGT